MDRIPVLVVGAGPTGLTTACALLTGGVAVRVIDRATGPAATSRALGLQPRGAEVLDRLGALGDLPGRSLPIRQVAVSVEGRELGRLAVGRPTPLVRRPGLLVSQTEIEGELRDRLTALGGRVEWGREATDLQPGAGGVDVVLDGGDGMRAEWVIGCDGAHSRVRVAAGIEFPGVPLVERFLLADVRVDLGLPRDTVAVWLRRDDMVAAIPLPGPDRWRLMALAPAATELAPCATELAPGAVLDALTAALADHTGTVRAIRECEWTSTFRIHRRLASTYRRGRILLAGDAAHIHSPFGGQGMNTGIGDAENLGWKLAMVVRGRAGEALLDTYSAERRPVAQDVLASTSSLTALVLADTVRARLLRDRVVVPLMNVPLVQRLAWEQASQLKVSYRGGPLGGRWWGPRPRPGDRVPDLSAAREDGRPTRLHAELGATWVLLAPATPVGEACAAAARLAFGSGSVTRLVSPGRAGRVLLVRPDAHLAWSGSRPAALRRWVDAALRPAAAVRSDTTPRPAAAHPDTAPRGDAGIVRG